MLSWIFTLRGNEGVTIMKTLCLYYTRTNTTKAAMEHLAKLLDADLAEYTDGKDRSGILGYISACFASKKKAASQVSIKGDIQLDEYDRVIIGMPVWAEGPCAIGCGFIEKYKTKLPKDVYYVVTHMSKNGYETKIKAMDEILGRSSAGQISLSTKGQDYIKYIETFAKQMK
jgi:flavodoxin